MSKARQKQPPAEKDKSPIELLVAKYGLAGTVLGALIGLFGTVVAGYFSYLVVRTQLDFAATQAAAANVTGTALASAPTATPTSPAPTATVTPRATGTSMPTSTPAPECQSELADDVFTRVLTQNPELASALGGRAMPRPVCIWSSYQPFEGGEMIWRSDRLNPTDIDVLFPSGIWEAFKSNYKSGAPLHSCAAEPPREYHLQPILGFGKTWCDNPGIQKDLGYAIIQEKPLDRPLQTFENGWLMLINNAVYALFEPAGNWTSFPAFDYRTLSLQPGSELSAPEANLGLAQGVVSLPAASLSTFDALSGRPLLVPFDVGWKASTQCEYLADRPDHIRIEANVSHPLSVYMLLQAGWGIRAYDGQRIGKVSLEFDGDRSYDTPLILGDNIRDWADRSAAVAEVSSLNSRLAWEGTAPDGTLGRMDILINEIPATYWSTTLKSIHIWDETIGSTGAMDPCIHWLAATVKYLP